jgi:hypothetical protein
MFEKTVCKYRPTDDGLGLVFTIYRGDRVITNGMTYDTFERMKKIARRIARRRIKDFILLD